MKTVVILVAISLGLLFPQISVLSGLIRTLVMLLLFFGFLTIRFEKEMLSKELFYIVAANLILPLPVYYLTRPLGEGISQAAFLVAATPTGVAVPIVIEFLHKKTHFAAMGVLLSNIVMAFVLPLGLPLISYYDGEIGVWHTVSSICITVIGPLLASVIVRKSGKKIFSTAVRFKFLSLYLWAFAIMIACSEARHFIIHNGVEADFLFRTAWVIMAVGICNFCIGYAIGGKRYIRESGQVLGQKNTIFSVWIGLTFLNPVSAIGPVCYIIFQNLFNCIQIFFHERFYKEE